MPAPRLHSDEVRAEILRLRKDEHLKAREIADKLGLKPSTVSNFCAQVAPVRLARCRGRSDQYSARKPVSQCQERTCLMCHQPFPSESSGHRRCDPCQSIVDGMTEYDGDFELVGVRLR